MGGPLDCLVLAAGASSRMGSWKLLLPWGQGAVLDALLASALEVCARVVLVVGFRGEELAERYAAEPRVLVARNPDWARGMLGSIRVGARLVETEAFFCIPGDMPLAKPGHFRALSAERERRLAAGAADLPLFPACGGELGHPVLIPSTLRPMVEEAGEGERLRPLLLRAGHAALELGDPDILVDLDDPAAYEKARRRVGA